MATKVFVEFYNGIYGVYDDETNIFTEDNRIVNKTTPEEKFKKIDSKLVPSKTRKLLNNILTLKKKRITRERKQRDIQNQIDKLEFKKEELKAKKQILENERTVFQKEINNLVKDYSENKKIQLIKKSVKGDELLYMSFYHGTLDKMKAKAIISKTKRPITYTYGLAYRNPTTYHVPKTVEEAFEIIDTESLLDIHFNKDEIHLNAYSGNDMW